MSAQSQSTRRDPSLGGQIHRRDVDLVTIKILKDITRVWYGSDRKITAASLGTNERVLHQWLTGRRPVPAWVRVKAIEIADKAKADRTAALQARGAVIAEKVAYVAEFDPIAPWRADAAEREASRTFVHTKTGYKSVRKPQAAGRLIGQDDKSE